MKRNGFGLLVCPCSIQDKYRAEMWTDIINEEVLDAKKFQGPDYYQRLLAHKADKQSTATKQVNPIHDSPCPEFARN